MVQEEELVNTSFKRSFRAIDTNDAVSFQTHGSLNVNATLLIVNDVEFHIKSC